MNRKIKSLLAIAAFTAAAFTAQAQIAVPDLFAGFKSTTDSLNLEINLGTASSLVSNAQSNGGTYLIGNFNSQLTSIFGADWNSASLGAAGTNWGVSGAQTTELQDTVWASRQWGTAAGTLGVKNSTSWAALGGATLNTTSVNVQKVYAGINSIGTAMGGNAYSVATSSGNSYSSTTTNPNAFATWANSTFQNNMSRVNASVGGVASDLYYMAPSTVGEYLGTFLLTSNGDFSFNVAAIPEPSTYAALLGVATLGFAALRRRKQALVA